MKFFFSTLIAVLVLYSCSQKKSEEISGSYVPELVLVDSMRIDRMVVPTLLDYSDDAQKFLFFDFKSNEFILTDNSGNILKVANRAQDGPDSYKSGYFEASRFISNDKILVKTFSGNFIYNLEFELIEQHPTQIHILSRLMGDTPSLISKDGMVFMFGFRESEQDQFLKNGLMEMDTYDFLKVGTADGNQLHSSKVPKSLNYIQDKGEYLSYEPNAYLKNDQIFLQFRLTPKLYQYSFPELNLLDSIDLNPGENFKITKPTIPNQNFDVFFEDLRGSRYQNFTFSNDYLITWYLKGAPDEEVDALDRRVVGDERFMSVQEKYKTPVYKVLQDDKKLWEGEWPIKLQAKKELLYSVNAKPGEDPNAEERDFQTFYFYELK